MAAKCHPSAGAISKPPCAELGEHADALTYTAWHADRRVRGEGLQAAEDSGAVDRIVWVGEKPYELRCRGRGSSGRNCLRIVRCEYRGMTDRATSREYCVWSSGEGVAGPDGGPRVVNELLARYGQPLTLPGHGRAGSEMCDGQRGQRLGQCARRWGKPTTKGR